MAITWNPADKNAAIALSGGNLTATSSAGSGSVNAAVRATQPIPAAVKTYFEVTVTGTVGQYFSVGVMNGAASLSANIAATNGATAIDRLAGAFLFTYRNGTPAGSNSPPLVAGQVIRVAVDRAANKIWWAVNNNIWSGTSIWFGSAAPGDDPATGTGGLDISTVTGTIYPAHSSAWTGDVAVFNGGAIAFAYAVPTGFVGIDAPALTDARVTQALAEHWLTTNPDARITQVMAEHWASVTSDNLQAVVTQVVLEHWASVASVSPAAGGPIVTMIH